MTVLDAAPSLAAPAQLVPLGTLPDEFEVEVNRLDILWGKRGGPECPIWYAVRRELRHLGIEHLYGMSVGRDVLITVTAGEPSVLFDHSAKEFVRRFDNGDRVEPRTVRLWRVGA